MMTTVANFRGRTSRPNAGAKLRGGFTWLLLFVGTLFATSALAENILQNITYAPLSGGQVQITMQFAGPVGEPQIFTTENPARIAVDMAGTRNGMSQRHIDVNTGATSAISAVEAAGRTRVVVDLFHAATYQTKTEGNNLVLTVNNGMSGSSTATAAATTDQTKTLAGPGVEVSNIDFRRGTHGEGRIIITFSGEGTGADLQRSGDKLGVDLYKVHLPPQLAQRLDVMDFATPVQVVETRAKGNGAHMDITATGTFEQLAYQAGNQYIIEIAPKKEDAKVDPNAPPVYSGNRVTFNFQDIPTRSVLQLIADVSDLNIVVADSVGGNVTLRLINVPWDQALDIVMQAKGLDKRRNGNVIWVAPQKEIADREQAIAESKQKLQEVAQTITVYIPVSYGKAKDIADLLTQKSKQATSGGAASSQQQSGFLSARGRVSSDDRTNTLLVVDTPEQVEIIRGLVAKLDKPVQQVLIESRVVVATDNFARQLGARFGISGGYQQNNTVVSSSGTLAGTDQMTNAALRNRFDGTGSGLPTSGAGALGSGVLVPSLANRLNVNMPLTSPAGSFGLAILGADYLLDLELSAAQTEGRSELISSPRVITANQQEADIKQGQEIGYVAFTGGSGGGGATATVQFKEAVLELKVTPTITADNRVFLTLDVKKDAINSLIPNPGGGFVPQLDKREINTSVLVDNGQTVVLGGVYEFDKSTDIKKVPFLGDIPGLGLLFRNTNNQTQKAELLIFVTPRILNDSLK
ncbi:MAG: type IV pilus secretin PilQ [Rudaea sp.]